MFKDVLNHMAGATDFASVGLVIFFLVFAAVTVRACAQPRRRVADWSRLPLADDGDARQPEVRDE